jgi:hypothetical protein
LTQTTTPRGAAAAEAAPPGVHRHYLIYGQRLCSGTILPELPRARFEVRDIQFRPVATADGNGDGLMAPDATLRTRHATNLGCDLRIYESESSYLLRWEGQCDFRITRNGASIEWQAMPGVAQGWVNSTLYGVVFSFVLHLRGIGNLHASAVSTPQGVIGFLADPGGGKSTLAASLAARGHPLVTDDVLALRKSGDGYVALPGFPYVSLSPASAGAVVGRMDAAVPQTTPEHAVVDDGFERPDDSDIPGEPNDNKARVPVGSEWGSFEGAPKAVRALFLINRSRKATSISMERPPAMEIARKLLEHTSCLPFLPPEAVAGQFAFAADLSSRVDVFKLTYPTGFDQIEKVVERILEETAR